MLSAAGRHRPVPGCNHRDGRICYLDSLSQMQKVLVISMVLAFPLIADDRSKETLSTTHTERFNVSAPGVIRLENSYGEVNVDGWDRPEVEVTVLRSSERLYEAKQQQLEVAAAHGHYLRPFAKILLALAALREKRTEVARTQFTELVAEFPENSLF